MKILKLPDPTRRKTPKIKTALFVFVFVFVKALSVCSEHCTPLQDYGMYDKVMTTGVLGEMDVARVKPKPIRPG